MTFKLDRIRRLLLKRAGAQNYRPCLVQHAGGELVVVKPGLVLTELLGRALCVLLAVLAANTPPAVADSPAESGRPVSITVTPPASPVIQLPVADATDLRFMRVSPGQGIATRVGRIVQDDEGFIWFGTDFGLERYDGYKFRFFAHDPKHPDSLG